MLRSFGLKPKSSCSGESSCVVPNPTSEGNTVNSINGSWPLRRIKRVPSEVGDNFAFVRDISRDDDLVEDKKVVFQQRTPSSSPSLVKHHFFCEEVQESESLLSLNLRQNKEEEDDREKLKIMWVEALYDKVAADTFIDEEELGRKARAAEELAQLLLLEMMELTKTSYDGAGGGKGEVVPNMAKSIIVTVETLQQKVKRLLDEKRNLALDLAFEIRSRMAERSAASEAFKLIERENNALQSSLDKELDRRSSEWGNKQEKLGEKRSKERVRDLAERNVALQREVSHLKNKETDLKSQLTESELYMDRLNIKLKEADIEIAQLRQVLTESKLGTKKAEDTLQSIKRCNDAKGRESYGPKKSFARLQWLLKDQERSISSPLWNAGLKGGINNDIPQENNGHVTAEFQKELIRVSGSADHHALCKDKLPNCKRTQSYHEGLRQEKNTHGLLGSRLISTREKGIGSDLHGLTKLDEELWACLDELQTQSLLLFDENRLLCSKLLETLKYKSNAAVVNEQNKSNDVVVNEHEMNVQRLERKVYFFKESVNMVKGILKAKTLLTCNETLRQDMNGKMDSAWQLSELQDELKAQTLITRLVREKMCSRELKMEQLREDVAMLIRNQELSKSEIKRLQNLLCSASHRVADLESQLRGKEEKISGLEGDLQKRLNQIEVLAEDLGRFQMIGI